MAGCTRPVPPIISQNPPPILHMVHLVVLLPRPSAPHNWEHCRNQVSVLFPRKVRNHQAKTAPDFPLNGPRPSSSPENRQGLTEQGLSPVSKMDACFRRHRFAGPASSDSSDQLF